MLLQNAADLWRIVVVGVLTYPALIAVLRLSGKRTLAKMNAFDLIVTVALGATLATILLSRDVALLEGLTALVLLAVLQLAASWLSVRFGPVRRLLKSQPTLLLCDGEIRTNPLREQRVTPAEVHQAIRSQGIGGLASVAAAALETDRSFSVIASQQVGDLTALTEVVGVIPDSR